MCVTGLVLEGTGAGVAVSTRAGARGQRVLPRRGRRKAWRSRASFLGAHLFDTLHVACFPFIHSGLFTCTRVLY